MLDRIGSSVPPRAPHRAALTAPAAPREADPPQVLADAEPVIDGNTDGRDRHVMRRHPGEAIA
jgi:hypothetical protein